jgi:hypothetical protein
MTTNFKTRPFVPLLRAGRLDLLHIIDAKQSKGPPGRRGEVRGRVAASSSELCKVGFELLRYDYGSFKSRFPKE